MPAVESGSVRETLPNIPAQTFPRSFRLNRAVQYHRVFQQAIRSSDKALTLLARPNGLAHARIGLAVSTKCAKRAVSRHRIKRLVRESFRKHKMVLPALDIVVICRPVIQRMTNSQVLIALENHWKRLSAQYNRNRK